MSKPKITASLIDKLISLQSGQTLPASALRGDWVEELLRDGVLVSRSHGSRRSIAAPSAQSLRQALAQIDERLADLPLMLRVLAEADASRSEQAAATGNSKLVAVRSCPGFPVNVCEPISCGLAGRALTIVPQEGAFLFVADWQTFAIPDDVTVVNIENMENFRLVSRQRRLFDAVLPGQRLLFVSRYPQSADLCTWLQTIPNRYVHFGDFDLAGIHIFLTEYRAHLGDRASFMIPPDIDKRLQHGSRERYVAQYAKFGHLSTDIPSLQQLIEQIHRCRRCYDQEGYVAGDACGE